jgi:hypothetical protein
VGIQERFKKLINGGAVAGTLVRPVNFAPPTVRDAINRVLEVGDEVLSVQPNHHLRVASIRPVTSPGAPPNLVELVLVSKVTVAVPSNASVDGLYLLRHQAEIGDGFLKTIGAEPAEAAPVPPPAPTAPSTIHLTDQKD